MENQRVRLTKKLLKQALVDLLQEKDIAKISIKEICERAELNRTTFYLHYSDQYQLLGEVEEELLFQMTETLSKVSPDVSAVAYIETFLNYIKKNKALYSTLILEGVHSDFLRRFMQNAMQGLRTNVTIQDDSDVQLYVYSFLIDGSAGILREWIAGDFQTEVGKVSRLIYELCSRVAIPR